MRKRGIYVKRSHAAAAIVVACSVFSFLLGFSAEAAEQDSWDRFQKGESISVETGLFDFIGKTVPLYKAKVGIEMETKNSPPKDGHGKQTTGVKRDKNLLLPNRHHPDPQIRGENNPYPEGHPRSYGECPRMSSLPVDYPYIFYAVSLFVGSYEKPPLKGVYHKNGI